MSKSQMILIGGGVLIAVLAVVERMASGGLDSFLDPYPVVEVTIDRECVRVITGVNENGEETFEPCDGEWDGAAEDISLPKRNVCPVWMREEGLC